MPVRCAPRRAACFRKTVVREIPSRSLKENTDGSTPLRRPGRSPPFLALYSGNKDRQASVACMPARHLTAFCWDLPAQRTIALTAFPALASRPDSNVCPPALCRRTSNETVAQKATSDAGAPGPGIPGETARWCCHRGPPSIRDGREANRELPRCESAGSPTASTRDVGETRRDSPNKNEGPALFAGGRHRPATR